MLPHLQLLLWAGQPNRWHLLLQYLTDLHRLHFGWAGSLQCPHSLGNTTMVSDSSKTNSPDSSPMRSLSTNHQTRSSITLESSRERLASMRTCSARLTFVDAWRRLLRVETVPWEGIIISKTVSPLTASTVTCNGIARLNARDRRRAKANVL